MPSSAGKIKGSAFDRPGDDAVTDAASVNPSAMLIASWRALSRLGASSPPRVGRVGR